ncbi:cell surface protein SprA [Parabacteroides sp. PF5-5]|uniref:T9SS outer membrane translocon Sov/SprA n=1 Tax=unclassified Parabacteroides TaxID=2649774 RepID=UPI002476771B|nr:MULTISPECIES: cell surface protein SprA [unclassified Parabacteroides]MDH6306635.1 cell surface protein SprA [Parabacteroides sp. PH5-39]MDH6317602.1 cell surface protein SprA [Parabacteroides sp. PF5-13]MDH6321346.1 cell surface protein SprA [Parabacteroides sp. PH5-13]MDH6325089.1 cell surface protein SprA [Parabacteroides sp. PH5-8]MDH6328798.1 cell surface protein SprA [Parabacteroides sp. PH5-41]
MKRRFTYIAILALVLSGAGLFSLNADYLIYSTALPEIELIQEEDTIPARFPVAKTMPEEYEDLLKNSPADLRDPDNVKTDIEYDIKTGIYIVRTKIGDMEIGTPLSLTPEEYQNYSLQESIRSYFRKKNEEEYLKAADNQFNITDMQFDIGPADRIFGPGGVRVRTQGSAEVTLGLKQNKTDNPSLPERSRKSTYFNFDENVQLNVQATVGTKVNFGMNYNTETTFDFDSQKLKLAYAGDEDEIIKTLEAGNVSMTTNNSLINGGAALFGIKADLQFGKLRVNTIFAQQNSESKTVNSKGGVQTRSYEVAIDKYDENRHFFLGHYFRDNYDYALEKLPYIRSSITINRVEVWITNKQSTYDQARNIVAFTDLGEYNRIGNPSVSPSGSRAIPYNGANTLYSTLQGMEDVRDIGKVTQTLKTFMESGREFEEIESARRLSESEYTVNKQLGYISLKVQLQPDEVLAVAYDYQYNGTAYQVGEFSTDNSTNTSNCLFVKLLKSTSMSPDMMFWDLMMKNVYSLDAYSVEKEKFRLNVMYQSDTTGTYLNYIQEGNIKDTLLLRVMNLDRLDSKNEPYPDGIFDFVEGITVLPDNGRVIFPVVEPFGSHLKAKIGNPAIAEKYVYQELYDSTLTVARQIAEKNKFILRGEYKASSGSEIQLGATNVARGSVRVTAAGAVLTENVDYVVDYTSGTVTILNDNIISSGTDVSVSLENQSTYSMQRKTMMGLDLNYDFSKNFSLGGTIMHLSEMPMTTKTSFGEESVKNTLWGLNTSYRGESQWLTNMLDKLPLLTLTKPSQITFNAEFAHLIAGHYENEHTGGYSYLDDFESTQSGFDLLNPYPWNLASTPYEEGGNAKFPEADYSNDVRYGMNRALFSWYYIDGMFTRPTSSLMPGHIKRNYRDLLSNHYVRAIYVKELFPDKQLSYNEATMIPALNVAYYPNERGPYNLDADGMNPDGTLMNPEKRWGGMMRRIDQSDFETANIEYIEFWMMDPYIYKPNSSGGDLYFNLGEISEDILKDGKKFFENGLPIDGDTSKVETTVWGKVPKQQSTVYAFDNTAGARKLQDVGLNGLSSDEERDFPAYNEFRQKLEGKLSNEAMTKIYNDPAGDNFHHYRGSDFDEAETGILDRYKYYNGTEGNSRSSEDSGERYDTSAKTIPDVEDLNQDNTMNKNEKYFQYKISLRPEHMVVGSNYIVDKRVANVDLENGTSEDVAWYQFKIPVKEYSDVVGSIRDFKTIRFMRMYMTGFQDTTILRFGKFEMVRGEWRSYQQDLYNPSTPPAEIGSLDVAAVNIEENGKKVPVNYVLPPGVTRMTDPGQPQLVQLNEQALSMKITGLASQDARAVYKNTSFDLRQYKRLQLFTHAEAFATSAPGATSVSDNDFSVFIRLGSDYKNNYYEYEVPLKLTPPDNYLNNNPAHREAVWPTSNLLNFRFEVLTNLKLNRNKHKRGGINGVTYQTVYSEYDPDNTKNTISVIGNPSLSEVKVIMIGVRNKTGVTKSVEVWVNELRLTDFNEEGGWAANANLNVALSDLGTVNLAGRIETAGFGGLDQSVNERRMDDYKQYSVATDLELGKFFPEKAKVSIPLYYAYSKEIIDPKYNPLDQDIKLKEAVDAVETKAEKDSITSFARERSIVKSVAVNNVRVDIKSKNPMPYDPANFTIGYSFSETQRNTPDTEYETTKDYRANFGYSYSPYVKPYRPFDKLKTNNGYTRYIKQLSLNYVPASINFQTVMMRNYYETQLRNVDNPGENNIPVSFSSEFYWDRAFSLSWNFTNSLRATFSSGTNARIEEPHVQVNKKLNYDSYQLWKDSVKQSITDLGRPMKYDQSFNVSYSLPFQFIPVLDWISSTVTYNATYNWERGAEVDETTEIGNTIRNQRQINTQGSFNFLNLYNKNKFLRGVNQKYGSIKSAPTNTRNNRDQAQQQKKEPKKREMEVQLSPDSAILVNHGMLTKRMRITARGEDGKLYRIKFKARDFSNIIIENKDTVKLKLTLVPEPPKTEGVAYKALEYSTRFLMMVRRMNIQYGLTDGMMVPGFRPEIGDIFGQGRMNSAFAPGLGFAFGSVRRSYIDELADRDWLVMSQTNVNPAIVNSSKNLTVNMNLEPLPGLKIDLNALRTDTRNTEIQYMYNGVPELFGGSFTMTTVAIGSMFEGMGSLENGYASKTFDKFLNNRSVIASRLESQYAQTSYPNAGFLENTSLGGQPYDPENGAVGLNSTDVLISAFLSAYTGKNPSSIAITAFPSIWRMLPNWRITYEGLIQIPLVRRYFKSLVLSHQYRASYSVGSFSSFLSWVDSGKDGLGYIRDALNNPTPSSPYDISAVSISDAFNPLIGIDGTLLNNVTSRMEYRKTRNLNLNISSYQLVETHNNEFIIGLGYKLTEFNKVLKRKASQGFSNDLTVNMDFSFRKMQSLIRKIEDASAQATSGNIAKTIQFSADYGLSRALSVKAFYDLQINEPLVSSTSYPTSNSSYGVSLRFSLAQ